MTTGSGDIPLPGRALFDHGLRGSPDPSSFVAENMPAIIEGRCFEYMYLLSLGRGGDLANVAMPIA